MHMIGQQHRGYEDKGYTRAGGVGDGVMGSVFFVV